MDHSRTDRLAAALLLAMIASGCALTAMPRPDGSDARDAAPWDDPSARTKTLSQRAARDEAATSAQDGTNYSTQRTSASGSTVETFTYCDHMSPSCPHNIVRMHAWSFGEDTGLCDAARVGRPLWLDGGDSLTVRVDPMSGGQPESVIACRVSAPLPGESPIGAAAIVVTGPCVRLSYQGYADNSRCICPTEQVWTASARALWTGRDRAADTLTLSTRVFETCGRAPSRLDTLSVRASNELLRALHTD